LNSPRRALLFVSLWSLAACASVEKGRFGLDTLSVKGNHALSSDAITTCLISRERQSFGITIGLAEPICGVPPFDSSPIRLNLWRFPWSEWPTFNRAVFDQDMQRVLRFYHARGYYDARIAEVSYQPEQVGRAGAVGQCDPAASDCEVDILIVVDEGEPIRTSEIAITGLDALPEAARAAARQAIELEPGKPIDEALHDRSKANLARSLRAGGWAGARVDGRVDLDTLGHVARVTYSVEPGPAYLFGALILQGHASLPSDVIERAAHLDSGTPFDPAVLREIQAEVFALGAFSAVEVEERLDVASGRADVVVSVTPLPPDALRVGLGVLSGATRRNETGELQSIPQWDLHLFARYQRRHLLGSLGQVTLEDRPRLIFNAAFPALRSNLPAPLPPPDAGGAAPPSVARSTRGKGPRPGNVASLGLNQPGLLEARTNAFARTLWDYGPDPYLGFFRSDLLLRLGLTRGFWTRRVLVTLALEQDIFTVLESAAERDLPASYRYAYAEQDLRLDLRDSSTRARSGAYFAINATQAPRWAGSDWAVLRVAPEARGYLPLPLDMVLAQRFALASLFVSDARADLDPVSRELGPTTYRLRGGGASSNRGFLAGTLGAGLEGGIRRWEASVELRIPIGQQLVLAGFADAGDVNRAKSYRFGHLNTSLGYGLRYHTIIGAIRLDVAHRVLAWQRSDGSPGIEAGAGTLLFSDAPGAVHLTIGDPF
jgi:outer membrane translocation and assembly module TamA